MTIAAEVAELLPCEFDGGCDELAAPCETCAMRRRYSHVIVAYVERKLDEREREHALSTGYTCEGYNTELHPRVYFHADLAEQCPVCEARLQGEQKVAEKTGFPYTPSLR